MFVLYRFNKCHENLLHVFWQVCCLFIYVNCNTFSLILKMVSIVYEESIFDNTVHSIGLEHV